MRRATPQVRTRTPFRWRISIHALHEESDRIARRSCAEKTKFQSTLSMRRATQRLVDAFELFAISIHALHEESDSSPSAMRWWRTFISIHALHEESDSNLRCADKYNWLFQSTLSMRRATPSTATMRPVRSFQSTLSMRRATKNAAPEIAALMISIHALHEESDPLPRQSLPCA